MNIPQLCSIKDPLHSAYDYLIMMMNEQDRTEKEKLEQYMLNRLRHAVENAGFEMVEKKAEAKEAA